MPFDAAIAVVLTMLSGSGALETHADRKEQVRAAEAGFARTMADRDHAAFVAYLAEDAVFFGRSGVQRGKAAVAAAWKPLFEAPRAPFAWEPPRSKCSTPARSQ